MKRLTPAQFIDRLLGYEPTEALLAPRARPVIPWPQGMEPKSQPLAFRPSPNTSLPEADVLVVTWTVAEALALSDVLTPGHRSKPDWYVYDHNWESEFKAMVKKGAPALIENRLGLWFPTQIGNKKVICFKSELHFARDGAKLPVREMWNQIIEEVNPELVITTGTAGGIGAAVILGDVVVSQSVRFDCKKGFSKQTFAQTEYSCILPVPLGGIANASVALMDVTEPHLPGAKRGPIIINEPVVTTDFFAFDDTTDHFGLQELGGAVEMGDAVLGLVCANDLANPPAWVAIRNASDPQMDGSLPYQKQVDLAGQIYMKYGYWTTINSAIACWAVIASRK